MADLPSKQREIDRIVSVGERTSYRSTKVPGLQLDVMGPGIGKYRVRFDLKGGRQSRRQGKHTLGDARILAIGQAEQLTKDFIAKLKSDGADPRRGESTFEQLFQKWLEQHAKPKKKSWQADVELFKRHVQSRLGAVSVAELGRRQIIEALDDIAASASGIQANRCQSLISATFNWALAEDLIAASPAVGIRKRAKETARERVLSDEEISRCWQALDTHTSPRVAAVLRLLLLTGLRLSEVCGMRRDELQGDVLEIPGDRTKSGLPHSAPLTPRMLAILNEVIDESSPFVFPAVDRGKQLDKPMRRYTPDHAYAELAVKLGMVDSDGS